MITRVVYNNKAFKILNEYSIKFSNNEVTFNDITIDFTGYTLLDIPYKYQEIKIMQAENEEKIFDGIVLFTGYLDNISLSEMKMQNEFREITLTLLSPLKLATRRNVSLIGTYDLKTAIHRVLQPLIDDGFTIVEMNGIKGQITTNFVLETVENCMNSIGSKRNIFWFINEKKEIFINAIDYLFGLPVTKKISYKSKEKGLLNIQPKIENADYANVINFKNVRLIYSSDNSSNNISEELYPIMNVNKTIKNGDIVTFDNPIIVDENLLRNCIEEQNEEKIYYCFYLYLKLENENYKSYKIKIDKFQDSIEYDKFVIDENITVSSDSGDEGELVLIKDNFFSNLFTGFKWNCEKKATIQEIKSDTALRYTTMRFMYSAEINKFKGVISDSGQIEKSIDYNEKWITLSELINYARSLMIQNSNYVNQVILKYDINPNLRIGDIVEIDEPNFYIQGKFAIKDISYTYYNKNKIIWNLTLKCTDLVSTYIDLFRPVEREENKDNINTVILSEFIEEKVKELHSIELDSTKHTMNFVLGG